MANMAYCRFRNTLTDLDKCLEVLESYDEEITSVEEREACKNMVTLMVNFLDRNSLIELTGEESEGSDYEINYERLDEMMGDSNEN